MSAGKRELERPFHLKSGVSFKTVEKHRQHPMG
jgi:hypothetical protein